MPRISKQQFYKECNIFREYMGDKNSSIETVENAFKGLTHVYLMATATGINEDTTEKDIESMVTTYESIFLEHSRRMVFRLIGR